MLVLFIVSVALFILVSYKENKLKNYYFESIDGHDCSEKNFLENYEHFNKSLNLCVYGKIVSFIMMIAILSYLSINF